jgi:hypothetical protein
MVRPCIKKKKEKREGEEGRATCLLLRPGVMAELYKARSSGSLERGSVPEL